MILFLSITILVIIYH